MEARETAASLKKVRRTQRLFWRTQRLFGRLKGFLGNLIVFLGVWPRLGLYQGSPRDCPVKAVGAVALPAICDSSFTCEDYNPYMAHPWSPFPLRRAHPGLGPHPLACLRSPAGLRSGGKGGERDGVSSNLGDGSENNSFCDKTFCPSTGPSSALLKLPDYAEVDSLGVV